MRCRINNHKCKIFLDFGRMPLANGFIKKKNLRKEYFYNLKSAFNESLNLFQLVNCPNPKKMFNSKYPFYTSSSNFMKLHFKKFSNFCKKKFLKKNSLVLEIGSNDGTFLKNFNKSRSFGFEPSKNVHNAAIKKNLNSINLFFNKKNIYKLKKYHKRFDLIVGSNVFCHIPDQKDLIQSINKLLSYNGTLIFEEPYLGAMYEKVSYDQIYDEHIYMFSASSIQKIYDIFGFKLIDAIPQITHGGSMRYIVQRNRNQKISNRLKNILKYEKRKNFDRYKGCLIFKSKVEKSKKKLIDKLKKIKSKNHLICGYGATSKSTTILNYCNIGPEIINCIFDTTLEKINKLSPGTHIPIKDYKFFKNSNYRYIFLFAWNHKKEILKKEKDKKNIKWLTHLN